MISMRPALSRSWRRVCRWQSSVATVDSVAAGNQHPTATADDNDSTHQPLVQLNDALLGFPSNSSPVTKPLHLRIDPPTLGGHALLGRNGSGKSLVGQVIVSRGHTDYMHHGSFQTAPRWHSRAIAHVSFDSHQDLLAQGGSTYKAISEGSGNLTKAAQFLVVRFGLYPLLQRDVRTLSTGEIRKVLLVRALSNRPKLLILDNAFDGLDVASREVLKDLVRKTIAGFTQDILVQSVHAKSAAHTQILMTTHRPEELVNEIEVISWFDEDGDMKTTSRNGRSGKQVLNMAMNLDDNTVDRWMHFDWDDPTLPSMETVQKWWANGREQVKRTGPVVGAKDLSIVRGDATLLRGLNWTVEPEQRWLIGGGNGAGKSTLSRLLAHPDPTLTGLQIDAKRVGWVSTEKHMEWAKRDILVSDMLYSNEGSDEETRMVAEWLGVQDHLESTFSSLSQGQQKMALVAAALSSKPQLLVLDEPCQGLDTLTRQRLLTMIERVCSATDVSLVYITHHFEELIPSVTHSLHLKERQAVYNGPIEEYRPDEL